MSRWLEQRSRAIALTDEEFYVLTARRRRNLTDGPIMRHPSTVADRYGHPGDEPGPSLGVGRVSPTGMRCYLDRSLPALTEVEVRGFAAARGVVIP